MEITILLAAFLLLAGVVVWHATERVLDRRVALRRRVVVNLADERAIAGVLWRRYRSVVVLRGAQMHEPGNDAVSMDGDVVIERDRVMFMQIAAGP